ncbi:MAG: tetratricopeptide repeat protein [Saprospiraceae bacterium]|nr:tetratricopeptide repeat protein [Saprospiraceae bacterium]
MKERKRQLAAIVFTDIVGYSALMQSDEQQAIAIRSRHREVFDELTLKYGGKILQYYGDGTLSVFNSAVSAVECAVKMQRAFSQSPAVPLRIGIHTGDITYDESEVFGDGVNVASRVESVANSGGIFISGKVYDDIKNHEWLEVKPVGSFRFKGISSPLELFAISNEGVSVPMADQIDRIRQSAAKVVSIDGMSGQRKADRREKLRRVALSIVGILAVLLPFTLLQYNGSMALGSQYLEKESTIAVLPFNNFSNDADNDYFSDGITEDILTLLSKIGGLNVVSRTSVMQYKDTEKSIRQIGRELRADHILEGSVRRDGDRVRVVAQLIDAESDNHLWAATYDTVVTEIFGVQSKVAENIAEALKKELSPKVEAEFSKKPTASFTAYDYYLQGRNYYRRYTEKDNDLAIQLFQRALDEDPSFALAHAGLGDALGQKAFRYGKDSTLLDDALNASRKAIDLDEDLSEGYKSLGLVYQYMGKEEEALQAYLRAVSLNPDNDMASSNISTIYLSRGEWVKAVNWAKRTMQINSQIPWTISNLAQIYFKLGDYESTRQLVERGIQLHPDFFPFYELMGQVQLLEGNLPEAAEYARHILDIEPESYSGKALLAEIALEKEEYVEASEYWSNTMELAAHMQDEYYHRANLGKAFACMKLGKAEEGQQYVQSVVEYLSPIAEKKEDPSIQMMLAMAYSVTGEEEKALRWAGRSVENGWMTHALMARHPYFEALRGRAAFRQLMEEVKKRSREVINAVPAAGDNYIQT